MLNEEKNEREPETVPANHNDPTENGEKQASASPIEGVEKCAAETAQSVYSEETGKEQSTCFWNSDPAEPAAPFEIGDSTLSAAQVENGV